MQAMQGSIAAMDEGDGVVAFSPSDLANLALWLKADSLTLNDGDAVASWTDSSANTAHCTQTATGIKPTYKTNIKNGKPVLRFDGNDWLAVPTSVFTGMSSNTLFVVCNATDGVTYKNILTYAYNYGSFGAQVTASIGSPASRFRYTNGRNLAGNVLSHSTTNATGWHLLGGVFDDGANMQRLYVAGVQEDSDANIYTTSFNVGDLPAIGAARNSADVTASLFVGDMAEIILYGAALSDADRVKVQSYLATKWDISLV